MNSAQCVVHVVAGSKPVEEGTADQVDYTFTVNGSPGTVMCLFDFGIDFGIPFKVTHIDALARLSPVRSRLFTAAGQVLCSFCNKRNIAYKQQHTSAAYTCPVKIWTVISSSRCLVRKQYLARQSSARPTVVRLA